MKSESLDELANEAAANINSTGAENPQMGSGTAFEIDLKYRPSSYFWPLSLETHLLSTVKGAERQKLIRKLIAENNLGEVPDCFAQQSLDDQTREFIGRIHPRLMGGEYLTDLWPNEVEIARVMLASTTGDVISVRARRCKHRIYYRVVDEYDNEYVSTPSRKSSLKPITLGQLEQLIEEADAGLTHFKEMLSQDPDFLQVTSPFYPELEALYQRRISDWLSQEFND